MTNQCQHGQLARVCELCDKDAEIAQLRQYLDTAQRRASALGDEAAGLREASKSALLVLCALRDTLVCHPNMGKDIDFAIEATRAALAARKGTT